jgi:hypothetical protein
VEEAHEAPNVILGIFLVNLTIAIVLFDSGASHSFISAAYVEKHNIPVAMLKCRMIVSSPGGDMPKGEIFYKGVEVIANLIVLDSKGIDVILGMDWMSKQKVLIDCAKKSVKLTTHDGQELEYVAKPLVMHKGATNHIKLNQMEAEQSQSIPIVSEYLNVFPEELPGMPPNHDIEFIIELLPRTAPIYKSPYRMSDKQLEELKEEI